MFYRKYENGGITGPQMTQGLANTMMKIEAQQDLNDILTAESKVKEALADELGLAEQAAQDEDWYSTLGRTFGGYGGTYAANKGWLGETAQKWSPAVGSIFDILGGEIGGWAAPDYKQKSFAELTKDINIPTNTKYHRNRAQQLKETGESGLTDIFEKTKKSRKDLRKENLVRGVTAFPKYAEVAKGEDWVSELFGVGSDEGVVWDPEGELKPWEVLS